MKSILLIGIGRFGYHIAKELSTLDVEILAIDTREESLKMISDYVTKTFIGDCKNLDFMKTIGVNTFDECIVAIGNNFQDSIETVLNLKELGAKRIVARAAQESQEKVLLKLGVDFVVYPEKQMGKWTALRCGTNSIYDFMDLDDGYGVFEVNVPKEWVGKTLVELDLRRKYNVSIVGVKVNGKTKIILGPNFLLKDNEDLIVVAKIDEAGKIFNR
ncbi:MAG: TrkA family potassium uptake protein [Lachnospiraceae bacterium]|nr:TrkA family potassium uptake protein [Lachnospiraceae bacterium]